MKREANKRAGAKTYLKPEVKRHQNLKKITLLSLEPERAGDVTES